MDIESKRFRIKSTGFGGFTVTNKETKESKQVSTAPHSNALAMMDEQEFDKQMSSLMN